jgi:hypothetical protein
MVAMVVLMLGPYLTWIRPLSATQASWRRALSSKEDCRGWGSIKQC